MEQGERFHLSPAAVTRDALDAAAGRWRLLLAAAILIFVPLGLVEAANDRVQEIEGAPLVELLLAVGAAAVGATVGDIFYSGVVAAAIGEHRDEAPVETDARGVLGNLRVIAAELPLLRLLALDALFVVVIATGLVLLIVPGIIAFVWFALAAPICEIEHRGVTASFRRSRELVRGNFWRVLILIGPVLMIGEAFGDFITHLLTDPLPEGFIADWAGQSVGSITAAPVFALLVVTAAHHLIDSERPAV